MRPACMTAMLLLAASLAGCNSSNDSPFDHERQAIERTMPAGWRLLSSGGPRRDSERTEASWKYQISGSSDTAKNALRAAFDKQYQLVHEDRNSLSFARFDGSDSFHVTFSMQPQGTEATVINVVLTGIPD